jgi:hypothetical protein
MAMSTKPNKRRRLAKSLISLKRVNDSTLEEIAAKLDGNEGVPITRRDLTRCSDEEFKKVGCTIDLPTVDGGVFTWELCRLDLLIQYFVDESKQFKDLMVNALMACRTLSMLFYTDEVVPGNILSLDGRRKFWAFYVSFKEFGAKVLCNDAVWLPLGILRSKAVACIRGGMSNCVRLLFRTWFFGLRVATAGLVLKLNGHAKLAFINLTNFVADLDAIKKVTGVKGSSSTKPCFKCHNVVSRRSGLHADGCVDICCEDMDLFHMMTDDEFYRLADMLVERKGELSKGAFDKLEKAIGIAYDEDGLIFDVPLRKFVPLVSITTFDWMHLLLCSAGCIQQEFYNFLKRCRRELKIHYRHIRQFVSSDRWCWPRGTRLEPSKLKGVFSDSREAHSTSETGFRAQASEVLGIYPLLRRFSEIRVEPSGKLLTEVASFTASCLALDTIMACKMGFADKTMLDPVLLDYFRKTKATYGESSIKPKHHGMLHVPKQELWDCFPMERKNKVPKVIANAFLNTGRYEKSVVTRTVLDNVRSLEANPVHRRDVFGANDIVLVDGTFYLVHYCVTAMLTASPLHLVSRLSRSTAEVKDKGAHHVQVDSDRIKVEVAFCWHKSTRDSYIVLHRSQ